MTFDISFPMPSPLRPSSPVQSVNEVQDPGLAEGEAVSVLKVVDCVEVDLLHPRRKWAVVECH